MKTKRNIVLILGLLMIIPLFNECRRGANDPWLSFRSRNSRISAVWSLESGYINLFNRLDEQFEWNNNKCEEATTQLAYNYTDTKTYTSTYSNSLVSYNQTYTTTRPTVDVSGQAINGNDYEDGNTISRGVNYSLELTIKTNGTYRAYITYNVNEQKYPQPADDNGDPQWGKTFSGTYEYTDNWHWQDDGLGTKSCIQFNGFPYLNVTVTAQYKLDLSYDYNYISDISFTNQPTTFSIDKLENKNLTFILDDTENGYYQQLDDMFNAYLNNGDAVECQGTYTFSTQDMNKQSLNFSSDGKNVDQ